MAAESSEEISGNDFDIVFCTNDVQSLVHLLNVLQGYMSEVNFFYSREGLGILHNTKDNGALVRVKIKQKHLLYYNYSMSCEKFHSGIEPRSYCNSLKNIQNKNSCTINKPKGVDFFFMGSDVNLNKEASTKLKMKDIKIFDDKPPEIPSRDLEYIKITTLDLSSLCMTLTRNNCKSVKFSKRGTTLTIKGFDIKGDLLTGHRFCRGSISDDCIDDEEDDDSRKKIKKGNLVMVINRGKKDVSVNVSIEKLKPLGKSNNMCKNGLVHIYIGNDSHGNFLYLKTRVGQIGTFELFIRDKDS